MRLRDRLGWVLAAAMGLDGAACNSGECTQNVVDRTSMVTIDLATACSVLSDAADGAAVCRKACGDSAITNCENSFFYEQTYFKRTATGVAPPDNCPTPDLLDGGTTVQLTCTVSHEETIPGSTRPCGNGRRPEGLAPCTPRAPSDVGAWLAAAAYLEAASVSAFAVLAEELEALAAPARLVDAARQAAREEESHAAAMTTIARRHGAVVEEPRPAVRRERSLVDVAVENAREGLVRETYGAVVMLACAQRAPTAALRATFAAIAKDECAHAELSSEIAEWARARLTRSENAAVEAARAAEIEALGAELAHAASPALVSALGLPSGDEAARLLAEMKSSVWLSAN